LSKHTPSQNFLTENFTLPSREGDETALNGNFSTPHDSIILTTVKIIESAPPQGGSLVPLALKAFLNKNFVKFFSKINVGVSLKGGVGKAYFGRIFQKYFRSTT